MYSTSIRHMDGDEFAVSPESLQHELKKLIGLLPPLARLILPSQPCRDIREHLHLDRQVCAEIRGFDRAAFVKNGCVIPSSFIAVAILRQAIPIGITVAEIPLRPV